VKKTGKDEVRKGVDEEVKKEGEEK